MPDKIEYRVRPVTRYIVTRYEGDGKSTQGSSRAIGEYDNAEMAYQVGYACAKTEHDRLGYPPGDERIVYPEHPDHLVAQAAKQQAVFMTANGPEPYGSSRRNSIAEAYQAAGEGWR